MLIGTCAAIAVAADDPPSALKRPVISGLPREGETLITSDGEWAGGVPMEYRRQWRRCDANGDRCGDIPDATHPRYTLTAQDLGSTVRARVFATNTGGTDYRSSVPTAVVTPRVGGAVPAPSDGAYFGAWTSPNTRYTVEQREAQIGRRYAIVHRYHDWNDVFPDASEREWAAGGRTLFLSVDPRIFGTSTLLRWAGIAAGQQDAAIDAMAARVKALGRPVLMDFTHEPETQSALGTPQQFAAAYRHVVERFRAVGARNVAWVWTVTGYSGFYSMYAEGLYPGDDVVDWIGWDPYNWYACHSTTWKSFARKVSRFYQWLMANGHADKPFMLSEFGSREHDSDPSAKRRWFADATAALKGDKLHNVKALVYFDSKKAGECDWRIDTSPESLDGYRDMASDAYLAPAAK